MLTDEYGCVCVYMLALSPGCRCAAVTPALLHPSQLYAWLRGRGTRDSCPRELSPGPQSKIPAWATVGLDIPQEELAAFLRSQTEPKTPALARVVDLLSPVWAPLLAVTLVAVAVYDAYRSFRRRKGREEENALSDQLRRIVALRSRLEDMALRLQALEGTSRAVRTQGIEGLCPLHHHLRQGGPALPTSLPGEGRVDGSPFTAADGL